MASFIYNSGKVALAKAEINWTTDTIKAALCTSTYTPNQDSHTYFSDVTNEVTGTNYTAGGFTLTSPTVTQDNTNNRAVIDAADISNASTSIASYRYIVVYKSTGVSSTSKLIALIDLGSDFTVDNATLDITWSSGGIINLN